MLSIQELKKTPSAGKIFWFSDLFPREFKVRQQDPDKKEGGLGTSTWPTDRPGAGNGDLNYPPHCPPKG